MIYLDNASTTRMDSKVFDAMLPYLSNEYGNPGGQYPLGFSAAKAIDNAREQVANFLNAKPEQIIFTSGGTEANNLALNSAYWKYYQLQYNPKMLTPILYTETEHDSIANTIESYNVRAACFPTEYDGTIDAEYAKELIKCHSPMFVTVMRMNNETGAVNPVDIIGEYTETQDVLFHTDCVQAAACEPLDVNRLHCDMLTISSHKIHGPKGIGALCVRDYDMVHPLIHGGGHQEFGFRGGTENVAAIVGFGESCERMREEGYDKADELRRLLLNELLNNLEGLKLEGIMHINGESLTHTGKILNLRFDGIDAETLVLYLGSKGVAVSTGSACRSHEQEPSRVLKAMGLSDEQARSAIRISTSRMNTKEEMKEAASVIANAVKELIS